MPREACEFCRRARARHKTRKKAGVFWYSSRGVSRIEWKQKTAKFRNRSMASLAVRGNRRGTSELEKQNESNPELQALVDLFKKESEIEEVSSPKDSASILSESINSVETVDEPYVLAHAANQMSKDTSSVIKSNSTEKPDLAHFKIAKMTLQQCVDLLQSLPTLDQCMKSGSRL